MKYRNSRSFVEQTIFSQAPDLNKQLYIIYGENDIPLTKNYMPDLAENLKKLAPPQFRFHVEIVSGSGHIPKTSLEDGLRFVFLER